MAQEQNRKKTATGTGTATKDSPKSSRSKKSQNDVRTVRSNSPSNGLKNEEKDGKVTKKTEGVAPKKKNAEPKPFHDPDQERIRIPKAPSESWNVIMPYLLCGAAVLLTLLFMIVFIGRIASGNGDAGTVGNFLRNLFLWVIGWASYLVPAALVVVALRWRGITERGKTHGAIWIQFGVVLVLTAAIFELLFGSQTLTWSEYGNALISFSETSTKLPGALFGGVIALVMRWALRQVFSAIVLIAIDLLMIMFFVGLTPEVIFHLLKKRHEQNRERRAEYLKQVEEARRAEAEAAARDRRAAEEAKAEEERKKKEEEAILRIQEREKKRREEEAKEEEERIRKEEEERLKREEEERAEEERVRKEEEERIRKEEERAEEERLQKEEEERLRAEVELQNKEEAVSDNMETESKKSLRSTDFDYDLDENTAKIPKTVLPGDDELFPSFEKKRKKPVQKAAPVDGAEELPDEAAEEELTEDEEEIDELPEEVTPAEPEYVYPPTALLTEGKAIADISVFADEIEAKKEELGETLKSFGVRFRNIEFSRGPTITRYEIQPEPGQRVKAIQNLMDDIALNLAVSGVRFEPSISGKSAVGIEVPNDTRETVTLRSLVESETFMSEKSKLTACLGADITGKPVVFDVSKMPHLLVAGATGMGKSVCINSIIVSLMYKATPDELRLILVDPKKVEFAVYRDMPHLQTPIITDPQKAAGALCSAVSEMEKRFELIERVGARDITGYKKITAGDPDMPKMDHIVIIIDELADLMMTASNDVEAAIMRIAQKARAAGIHLIIGTQRPSVDVITGTIKANIPSRIACTVASQTDSRTILDAPGAEKLCGRGDMLFAPVGASRPRRVQGSFVSDDEVQRVVNFLINNNGTAVYDEQFMRNIDIETERCMNSKKASAEAAMISESDEDPKLNEAIEIAIESGKISTSLLQRHLKVGYGRAASIIDHMEELGIVSGADGNKPRKILITMEEYRERLAASGEEE